MAQISSISELLEISNATVYELTDYLQYEWNISRPTEVIEDGVAVGRYTYNKNFGGKTQILQREIRKDLGSGFTLESTRLTSNDKKLYEAYMIQLKSMGFSLKFEREGKRFYSRGRDKVIIYPKGTEEVVLSEGYYLISIPSTYAN